MKACLDAGHGFNTAGKRTPKFDDGTFIHEAEQNYPVMFKVAEYLKYNGIDVCYTNTDINIDVTLQDRVKTANNSKADLFVSIHSNAMTGIWQTGAKGIETYVYKRGAKAETLANFVHDKLIKDTEMYDRGIREASFYVLRKTDMPAILVELGFMDHRKEAEQMIDPLWHDKYAKAIVKGICAYFCKIVKFPIEWNNVKKDIDKVLIDTEPSDWKQEAIKKLLEIEIITDPSWLDKADEPVPVWAFAIVIDRVIDYVFRQKKGN